MKQKDRGWTWYYLLVLAGIALIAVTSTACSPPKPKVRKSTRIRQAIESAESAALLAAQERPAANPLTPQVDYYLWQTSQWYLMEGMTMTTELCQDWVGFWQSDEVFLAARTPYTQPVVFRGAYSPTLILLDERGYPATQVLTIPLEYRPERLAFLESELPPAPGEHWLALGGVTSPTITCPSIPDLGSGEWEFLLDITYDFGGGQGVGEGNVLPQYYCYQGQAPPFFVTQLSRALGRDGAVTSYQGEGVTAVGPDHLTLLDDFDWALGGDLAGVVTPTLSITLSHHIGNWGHPLSPITFTLEYTSTLGDVWGIYSGTAEGADIPLVEISGPFRVDDWSRYFWLIAEVPSTTADGPYNLFVTATVTDTQGILPATASHSSLIWVGEWVAPPRGMPYRVYLPLVLRHFP